MKRAHEERIEHREGVLNSGIRTVINTAPASTEKDKIDKGSFGQSLTGNDPLAFRTADLIKAGRPMHSRPIAPACIATPHLPPMPALQTPLLPGFLHGGGHPLLNSAQLHQAPFVRGSPLQTAQYPFPTHIPILGAAAAAVAPPRASAGSLRSSVPTLRLSSIPSQVSSSLAAVRPSTMKTPSVVSPRIASPAPGPISLPIAHSGSHRIVDSRLPPTLSDSGHVSVLTAPQQVAAVASVQVKPPNDGPQSLAPHMSTAKPPHTIPLHNALKIGPVTSQATQAVPYSQQPFPIGSSAASSSYSAVTAFKLPGGPNNFALGVGQLYSQPPIIMPSSMTTVGHSRSDTQLSDIRPGSLHSSTIMTSALPTLSSTNNVGHQPLLHGANESQNDRGHHMNQAVTYPIGTYFMRDPVSGFPHIHQINSPAAFQSLLRPPPVGSSQPASMAQLPLLAVDSNRGAMTSRSMGPLTPQSSKPGPTVNLSDARHPVSDSLQHPITHANSNAQTYNRYPNLQPSSYMSILPATNSNSQRPGILRKRALPVDTYGLFPSNFFPVQTSEKVASPTRIDNNSTNAHHTIPLPVLSSTPTSLPSLTLNESQHAHSDSGSVGSDSTASASEACHPSIDGPVVDIKKEPDSTGEKYPPQRSLLQPSSRHSPSVGITGEASPRKKPRKQLVITTEDKYGMETPMEHPSSDEEEEDDDEEESSTLNASYSHKFSNDTSYGYASTFPSTVHPRQHSSRLTDLHQVAERWRGDGQQSPQKHSSMSETIRAPQVKSERPDTDSKESVEVAKHMVARRPRLTILGDYKVNGKAAYNHFHRHSDVRVKDDRRHTCAEIANRKGSRHAASGWKLIHVSSQLDDLSSLEEDVCSRMLDFQSGLPKPSRPQTQHQKSPVDEQLRLLHELIQGNIQRCRLSIEQLKEGKQTMMKVLDYKPKALELLKKYKQRKLVKKKQCSSH